MVQLSNATLFREGCLVNGQWVQAASGETIAVTNPADRRDMLATIGVKMDIEGIELEAVRGMTGIISQVDFLICEVNIRNRAEGVYQFSDLVAELAKHDLVFFNFLNQWKPNARFYDVAFLPRNSPKFDQISD